MAQNAYAKITFDDGGEVLTKDCLTEEALGINSPTNADDYPEHCLVFGFEFNHLVAVNVNNNKAQGSLVHETATIQKAADASSPLLRRKVADGKTGGSIEITNFRQGVDGIEEYMTFTFSGVTIQGAVTEQPDIYDSNNSDKPDFETIEFTYQKLDIEHTIAGKSGSSSVTA